MPDRLAPRLADSFVCAGRPLYTTTHIYIYNTLQSSQPFYLCQLFTIQPPRSTRSSSTQTLLRPSVTSSLKFSHRSIAIHVALPLFGTNSRQCCDKYLTHRIRTNSNFSPCHLSSALSLQ